MVLPVLEMANVGTAATVAKAYSKQTVTPLNVETQQLARPSQREHWAVTVPAAAVTAAANDEREK